MKSFVLTFIFLLTVFVNVNAQSDTPTVEQKQTINPIVDKKFVSWSSDWRYDSYVSRSAKITYIEVDEDYGDIKVSGTCSYKRVLVGEQDATFSATLSTSDGYLKVVKMSITDAGGIISSKKF